MKTGGLLGFSKIATISNDRNTINISTQKKLRFFRAISPSSITVEIFDTTKIMVFITEEI